MIIKAYAERLSAKMEEAGTGAIKFRTEWAVLDGTGKIVRLETLQTNVSNTTELGISSFADGATEGTDPNRMHKILTVSAVNTDLSNSRNVQVYLNDVNGHAPLFRCTLASLASVKYSPATGWVVNNAAGLTGIAGPAGPTGSTGPTGATGSDGWTYTTLANNFANSTTTPSDVTGLSFSALANTKYEIEIMGVYQTAAATTGIGFSFSAPAGATVAGMAWTPVSTTALGSTMQRSGSDPTAATASVDTLNSDVPVVGKWIVENNNNAGTVQLRMRSEIGTSAATLIGGRFYLKRRVIS